MKIVLLSDLHLTFKDSLSPTGFNVNEQFLKLIQKLKQIEFDHLIILGDVCLNTPEYEIYDWFFDEIEQLKKPFDLVPGNHDNSELIIKILDQPTVHTYDKEIFFAKEIAGRFCLFLDTSAGKIEGQQLDWLTEKVLYSEKEIFVFMHHPPCNARVPFMDANHYLKNRDKVSKLFRKHDYRIDVFAGHYHIEKNVQLEDCHIHICPSPYFNLDDSTHEFLIDHRKVCYQVLTLKDSDFDLDTIYLD